MNMNKAPEITKPPLENHLQKANFYEDVIRGLSSSPKYLDAKYFYDARGDELFEQIMQAPEYYLTNCELEILFQQSEQVIDSFSVHLHDFDMVELGAGNALKSFYLLKSFRQRGIRFTYFPIDISAHVISMLTRALPKRLPGLNINGLHG